MRRVADACPPIFYKVIITLKHVCSLCTCTSQVSAAVLQHYAQLGSAQAALPLRPGWLGLCGPTQRAHRSPCYPGCTRRMLRYTWLCKTSQPAQDRDAWAVPPRLSFTLTRGTLPLALRREARGCGCWEQPRCWRWLGHEAAAAWPGFHRTHRHKAPRSWQWVAARATVIFHVFLWGSPADIQHTSVPPWCRGGAAL